MLCSHHKQRCADFVDLEKMAPLVEAGAKPGRKRISGTPVWYEEPDRSPGKNSDAPHSASCWVIFGTVLMYSYVLFSSDHPDGSERCATDGILPHLNRAEFYARLDSTASGRLHGRHAEAASTIRHDRRRGAQQDLEISLDDAIDAKYVARISVSISLYFFFSFLVLPLIAPLCGWGPYLGYDVRSMGYAVISKKRCVACEAGVYCADHSSKEECSGHPPPQYHAVQIPTIFGDGSPRKPTGAYRS